MDMEVKFEIEEAELLKILRNRKDMLIVSYQLVQIAKTEVFWNHCPLNPSLIHIM